jgi:hypothetical protein
MKKSIAWRSLKIAGRLFGAAVVGYAVLLFISIGTMYSQPRGISAVGDVVEAIVFFPQRFLPPPTIKTDKIYWVICAVWMFGLLYVPAFACAALTTKKKPIQSTTDNDGPAPRRV